MTIQPGYDTICTLQKKPASQTDLVRARAAGILCRLIEVAVKVTQDQRWEADTTSLHLLHTRLTIL